jgi:hypothetical protein
VAFKPLKEMSRGAQMDQKGLLFRPRLYRFTGDVSRRIGFFEIGTTGKYQPKHIGRGILNLAAQGERDPKRLRAAALALAA